MVTFNCFTYFLFSKPVNIHVFILGTPKKFSEFFRMRQFHEYLYLFVTCFDKSNVHKQV